LVRIIGKSPFARVVVALMMVLFLFLLALPSYAQDEPPEKGRRGMGDKFGEFGLTPEQRGSLKVIRQKYEDKRGDILFSMKEKKLELVRLIRESKPDKKKIEKKLQEITALEGERQKLLLDEFFEVREVLTPEQAQRFTNMTIKHLLKE
jgi:Spy/CpxP family protein refolding chaperone